MMLGMEHYRNGPDKEQFNIWKSENSLLIAVVPSFFIVLIAFSQNISLLFNIGRWALILNAMEANNNKSQAILVEESTVLRFQDKVLKYRTFAVLVLVSCSTFIYILFVTQFAYAKDVLGWSSCVIFIPITFCCYVMIHRKLVRL